MLRLLDLKAPGLKEESWSFQPRARLYPVGRLYQVCSLAIMGACLAMEKENNEQGTFVP